MQQILPLESQPASPKRFVLQRTSLAGFRHHEAPQLWPALRRGQSLTLVREPDNAHDPQAVVVQWRGRKLGYLPRKANLVAAVLLDKGRTLTARIDGLSPRAERNQ
ncbi:MAG: HIRAN domain-containing protein, partial [Gammaproteobacteria bacterium]